MIVKGSFKVVMFFLCDCLFLRPQKELGLSKCRSYKAFVDPLNNLDNNFYYSALCKKLCFMIKVENITDFKRVFIFRLRMKPRCSIVE